MILFALFFLASNGWSECWYTPDKKWPDLATCNRERAEYGGMSRAHFKPCQCDDGGGGGGGAAGAGGVIGGAATQAAGQLGTAIGTQMGNAVHDWLFGSKSAAPAEPQPQSSPEQQQADQEAAHQRHIDELDKDCRDDQARIKLEFDKRELASEMKEVGGHSGEKSMPPANDLICGKIPLCPTRPLKEQYEGEYNGLLEKARAEREQWHRTCDPGAVGQGELHLMGGPAVGGDSEFKEFRETNSEKRGKQIPVSRAALAKHLHALECSLYPVMLEANKLGEEGRALGTSLREDMDKIRESLAKPCLGRPHTYDLERSSLSELMENGGGKSTQLNGSILVKRDDSNCTVDVQVNYEASSGAGKNSLIMLDRDGKITKKTELAPGVGDCLNGQAKP